MRKLGLRLAGLAAVTALGGPAAPAPALASADDWNQFAHDAARTSASDATGPILPRVLPGWPVDCGYCGSGPVVSKLQVPGEPQPHRAVFSGSNYARTVFGFDGGGRPLPGWPAVLGSFSVGGSVGFPAVSAAAGARVFAASQGDEYGAATVYGLSGDGRALPAPWPWVVPPDGGLQIHQPPALVEDAPTARADLTVYFIYQNFAGDSFLNAVNTNGTQVAGWPVRIGDGLFSMFFAGPAVAFDGTVYVLREHYDEHGTGDHAVSVDAYTASGQRVPGWPVRLSEDVTSFLSAISVGRDGTVYAGVAPFSMTEFPAGRVYAIAPDGRVKSGWPVELAGTPILAPAVGLDGTVYVSAHRTYPDRELRQDYVYAIDPAGTLKPSWPLSFETQSADVQAGAVAGLAVDRRGRVFFGSGEQLYAYSPGGRPLPGWPLAFAGRVPRYPALSGDGVLYFTADDGTESNGRIYAVANAQPRPKPKLPVPRKKKIDDFTATPNTGPWRRPWLR